MGDALQRNDEMTARAAQLLLKVPQDDPLTFAAVMAKNRPPMMMLCAKFDRGELTQAQRGRLGAAGGFALYGAHPDGSGSLNFATLPHTLRDDPFIATLGTVQLRLNQELNEGTARNPAFTNLLIARPSPYPDYSSMVYTGSARAPGGDTRLTSWALRLEVPNGVKDEILRIAADDPDVIDAMFLMTPFLTAPGKNGRPTQLLRRRATRVLQVALDQCSNERQEKPLVRLLTGYLRQDRNDWRAIAESLNVRTMRTTLYGDNRPEPEPPSQPTGVPHTI